MYGNEPALWIDGLSGNDRLRFIVNALTRLRIVDADGRMHLKFKDGAAAAPGGNDRRGSIIRNARPAARRSSSATGRPRGWCSDPT